MNMNMVRPCPNCPFRTDIPGYLTPVRVRQITNSLLRGATFTCHKTTISDEDSEWGETKDGPNAEHCAGALIFLEANDSPSQLMRIYERLGGYDMRKLDMESPVFTDAHEMAAHHGEKRRGWSDAATTEPPLAVGSDK